MIIELLLVVAIVNLIFFSGFPFEMDELVAKHWRFHHIPKKPFLCPLCMSFWMGIIYLLVTQQFTLFGVFMLLIMSNLSDVFQNAFSLTKVFLNLIMRKLMELMGE